ncbi:DUF6702 family protein [uncultured Nonlabens sp.]|uniref:DUF6702 family protein n=1 Tax=uncultured Nonlabens sp. TaxID=859306 RepID=UPI0026200EE2|nr:DUF6702 family protein [uncultured Nonlabens sp.]
MKNFKILFLLSVWSFSLSSFSLDSKCENDVELSRFRESENNNDLHKYYISVSNVTYSESAKSLQMITRFFIDDLEDVLNSRIETPVVLGDDATIEDLYPLIKSYLNKKLEVKINDQVSSINFLGAEYEGDQIALYIEIPAIQAPIEVSMKFNAFLELFEEQKNLVHLKINGERRTLLMDKNKGSDTVKF